ncbi:hypothetical protein ABZ023_10390 [Streptomyces sp. NPDC006367]|uniref:hypothetical protein n=1 Tax=unclassified Streptomyces TaxID=2593676 RepID=UPI0033A7982B
MLSSLEEALREVRSGVVPTGDPAWVRQVEDVAEEIRRFQYAYGPLLREAVAVQRQLRQHPDLRDLEPLRIGPDGRLGPEALERAERLTQLPAVAALGASAARQGCKGMGLVTANAEAAVVIGAQAGAELVWLWPYKVGTFRTPNRVVGRAWYTETIGVDIGYSATPAPFPFDLSFWFLPPESTSHLVGAYVGYEGPPLGPLLIPLVFGGARIELFGWVPDVPPSGAGASAEPSSLISDVWKYLTGFRIVAEAGLHLAIGLVRKGRQITTAGGIDLATYNVSPTNLQTRVQYDGSDAAHPLVHGSISCPQRDDVPSKQFQTGEKTTTLKLTFPKWMCTGMSAAPTLTFDDDGSGGTTNWQLTNQPTTTDPTYEYQWVGAADQTWQQNISFHLAACSSDAPPLTGQTMYELRGLADTLASVNVPFSTGDCTMTLSAEVFSATGSYTLTVDPDVNPIEDYSGSTVTADLAADNANADPKTNPNNFSYLPDPNDSTKQLIIDYPMTAPGPSNEPTKGRSWYVGYQFQQQDSNPNAQFRAVFWEVGQPFLERNLYFGPWQSLIDPTRQYTSTAIWSNGAVNNSATLTITLTPSA